MSEHNGFDVIVVIAFIALIIWGFYQAIPEKITVQNNELISYAKKKYNTDDAESALAYLYEDLENNSLTPDDFNYDYGAELDMKYDEGYDDGYYDGYYKGHEDGTRNIWAY